ncbi:MAG: NACHT domain-containing protein [Cyanobacteria bacterium P01_F01_bin.143]
MSNFIINVYSSVFAIVLAVEPTEKLAEESSCWSFLQAIFSKYPVFESLFGFLPTFAIVIATLATVLANLQKIIDFVKKNLLPQVSEEEQIKLRKQLLQKLQNDVAIRRRDSLHKTVKIDLEMEEQRHRVGRNKLELAPPTPKPENRNLFHISFQIFKKNSDYKQVQNTINFFDREDINGKLLILGEPGAGKTTELLSLTEKLIERAIEDETTPIPVIFELSSWASNQNIRDWIIEKLCEIYLKKQGDIYKKVPKKVAQQWIDNQQIIPLLDGLDELGLENGKKCIVAINKFLDSSFQPGLVVCCRQELYEKAKTQLKKMNGAIYIESLSDEKIKQYLTSLDRLYIWNETIRNEPELLDLVRKPLFLTMLV